MRTLRKRGAILVDNLEIDNIYDILKGLSKDIALKIEFKQALNAYLQDLVDSPVRSLADVIAFNKEHSKLEKIDEYDQDIMLEAQKTSGIGKQLNEALLNMTRLSKNGFEKLLTINKLDAVVTPFSRIDKILDLGGYPGIVVPAGYLHGVPFGICFGGLKGSEPKLIEIAYSFEQATKIRKPPSTFI
ncbi:hypothetical protein PIB30_119135 [Stylosanthes scabra]|uniref:Amidase domain-containing protein n=1 Tax=Stylosanthes scabra TaxID=79078 RepID=A0ABU6UAC9_9FABA|nr:hypothetical protein [Stylosanthes scabra]